MNKCLALVVLIALISALDSAVLRQRRFVKAENALKAEQKENPATADVVDNGNSDKIQGAEKEGQNSDEPKSQGKQGMEPNSKKTEMPEIRGAEALAQKGTAPLLLKHETDELVKGKANTRKKRQSGGLAKGDKAAEKMPNKFDLTLPKYDPSKSAVKAAEYESEFDRNNTPVDYDGKEKKCKVEVFYFPLPIFRWNASECHPKILINESTNAIQRIVTGTEKFYDNIPFARSCRAEPIKMPSSAAGRIGIIYAEYRILAISGNLFIGLSTKEMPLADECPGYYDISYGYVNYGSVRSKNANGNKVIISDNVPSFGTGDVIGYITNLYVDEETADFYPTVSIVSHGDAVNANFGPNFEYDLSNEF
ncbi:hypothetical protein niasHT_005889 [Heterodera trifolii]|uniref:Effector protein n=1 Tax=Heterodera trifolii TaxID=157864 RepID=A0ABD2LZZ7_9BILA